MTGAVSGRSYTTPDQYTQHGDDYMVLSQRHRRWWRNIALKPTVRLLVRGADIEAHAGIADGDDARSLLADCLSRQPRIAKFYRISVEHGVPDPGGIDELATRVVVIAIEPTSR